MRIWHLTPKTRKDFYLWWGVGVGVSHTRGCTGSVNRNHMQCQDKTWSCAKHSLLILPLWSLGNKSLYRVDTKNVWEKDNPTFEIYQLPQFSMNTVNNDTVASCFEHKGTSFNGKFLIKACLKSDNKLPRLFRAGQSPIEWAPPCLPGYPGTESTFPDSCPWLQKNTAYIHEKENRGIQLSNL